MMLSDQLQHILSIEEQERTFYQQQLKPALNRLEHAEDLHDERIAIENLVAGTAFEQAFQTLDASGGKTQDTLEHLYKLNHVCHDLMHTNHLVRQSEIEALLDTSSSQTLTPIVLYYLGRIYSQGDRAVDSERADEYLRQALALPLSDADLTLKIRELLAQNYDRWQLRKDPPQPQKYGTIYADHFDVPKGLEKDHLIPPCAGYHYQIEELDQARHALGLYSFAEQEERRRLSIRL